jgi:hypothetical protein
MTRTRKQLNKHELMMLLVDMVVVGDAESIGDVPVLKSVAPSADWAALQEAVALIKELFQGYDYAASPEFDRSAQGKSSSVRMMLASMANDPDRRRAHKKRFQESLYTALDRDDVYQLIPESKHEVLKRIVQLMKGLSVPD